MCPGNNESAGKRKKVKKTMQGNKHLKGALWQAAWANSRSSNRIGQFFRRIRKRRGDKKSKRRHRAFADSNPPCPDAGEKVIPRNRRLTRR
ncbi:transposase [Paenibacillus rhizoplanae]